MGHEEPVRRLGGDISGGDDHQAADGLSGRHLFGYVELNPWPVAGGFEPGGKPAGLDRQQHAAGANLAA